MKKAIMYGAGNIGRGFIAQLFCESVMKSFLLMSTKRLCMH